MMTLTYTKDIGSRCLANQLIQVFDMKVLEVVGLVDWTLVDYDYR
jgi:hypothetical protein